MEILVIIVLVVVVGAVLAVRKFRGTPRKPDISTGNPSANDDRNDI